MKKSIFLIAFMLVCISISAQKSAAAWCNNVHIGWCLGNALEAFNDVDSTYEFTTEDAMRKNYDECETSWINPRTTRAMIDSVRAAGFDAVRIPVRWYPHFIYRDGKMTIDAQWLKRVHEIVDWCLEDGMQVIINTHHEKWIDECKTYNEVVSKYQKFSALWAEIARSFADYDNRLAFAGTCEVHDSDKAFTSKATAEQANIQNTLNQAFVDAVRSTGGKNLKRILIVQTYACEPYFNPQLFKLPNDTEKGNIIAEVHVYAPFMYCMLGHVKYFGDAFKDYNTPMQLPADIPETVYSNNAPQLIANTLIQEFLEHDIPVIVGEFGAGRWNKVGASDDDPMLQSRIHYYTQMVLTMKKAGIPCFAWDNGDPGDAVPYKIFFFDRHKGMTNIDPLVTEAIAKIAKRKNI